MPSHHKVSYCSVLFSLKPDAFTDIESHFMESSRSTVAVKTITYVYDIKSWISPYLDDISKHTTPHIFRFTRTSGGKAQMQYKHWSHEEWESPAGGITLLKVIALI